MDDERTFVEDRDRRLRVGIGAGAVAIAALFAVVRLGRPAPPADDAADDPQAVVQRAFDARARRLAESPPELPIAGSPIELELVVDGTPHDIIPDRAIELSPEVALELEPSPTRIVNGHGFWFSCASTISVVTGDDLTIAARDGDVVELVTTTATPLALLGPGTPVERAIAGSVRRGTRHDTASGLTVEVYDVALAPDRHVGVGLFRRDPDVPLGGLAEVLETLAPGAGAPSAWFTVRGVPLLLDRPARLDDPPIELVVRRRRAVVRTIDAPADSKYAGSLTFEHPVGFAVTRVPNPAMLAVAALGPDVGIQLVALPYHVSFEELRASLVGALRVKDLGEVVRGTGPRAIRGRKLALEHLPVITEIYLIERGPKTIGAMVQYHADAPASAPALALGVLMSVQ